MTFPSESARLAAREAACAFHIARLAVMAGAPETPYSTFDRLYPPMAEAGEESGWSARARDGTVESGTFGPNGELVPTPPSAIEAALDEFEVAIGRRAKRGVISYEQVSTARRVARARVLALAQRPTREEAERMVGDFEDIVRERAMDGAFFGPPLSARDDAYAALLRALTGEAV